MISADYLHQNTSNIIIHKENLSGDYVKLVDLECEKIFLKHCNTQIHQILLDFISVWNIGFTIHNYHVYGFCIYKFCICLKKKKFFINPFFQFWWSFIPLLPGR